MARQYKQLKVWHWNANGYRCRRAVLQQVVQAMTDPPDVILIQETHTEDVPKLLGYRAHASPPSSRAAGKGAAQGVCIFVKKGINFIPVDLSFNQNSALEACAVELSLGKSKRIPVTIVNTYSNPQHRGQRFKAYFQNISRRAAQTRCIVAGDFNAPHKELGYPRTTAKGDNLLDEAAAAGFQLLTDPCYPSRLGTSTARDTTPDLAFIHLPVEEEVRWRNTGDNLGSDHFIIEVTLRVRGITGQRSRNKHQLIDWNAFRNKGTRNEEITDVEDWTKDIVTMVKEASTEIETDTEVSTVDTKLAHLIEARQSIQRRWRRNRTNRNLRRRVARLGKEIESYSRKLCRQQWDAICREADGRLHTSRTWQLFRHLRDETKSKSYQHHRMAQILQTAVKQKGEREVCNYLNDKYLPETQAQDHPEYAGEDNSALDADIEEHEVRCALAALNCKSAAGPDGVHNKALRNLGDYEVTKLTAYYNKCWRAGQIPRQWKQARTVLIPKPGKPPNLENLRPISLTSCVGKVLEHVLNNRWQRHLETTNTYPDSMIGFRNGLCTQDAMLLIQKDILDDPSRVDCRAILGLDVKSAFDNVSHAAVLKQVERLNLGRRTYNYIRDFLTGRTAQLQAGHLQLPERKLGSKGTPQGAVISPLLFNLVMIPVAESLAKLPQVHHTIYADDVTLWTAGGPLGHVQDRLQEAVKVIERQLDGTGLQCAPQKSELLVLPPPGHWRKDIERQAAEITIKTRDGGIIPHVKQLRILGMHVDRGPGNPTATSRLVSKIGIATRLVKQVTTSRTGMREKNLLKLAHSFIVSHVTYVGAFHRWLQHETARINAAIRKAYKAIMGLFPGTSNAAFAELGVCNTLEEIGEAQRISQINRLGTTKTGRAVLHRARIAQLEAEALQDGLQHVGEVARRVTVYPLPRNMHPEENKERRRARARALALAHETDAEAYYVDAARYSTPGGAYTLAVIRASDGECVTAASVRTQEAIRAEEAAIALAIGCSKHNTVTILSDSMSAVANFGKGYVGQTARALLPGGSRSSATAVAGPKIYIRWFPAHMGATVGGRPNRNEEADSTARELTHRAAGTPPSRQLPATDPCPITNYSDLLVWYREQRRSMARPHHRLSREEEVHLRRLQTGTVLTPALARHVRPGHYASATCSVCCAVLADLPHVLWGCNEHERRGYPQTLPERINSGLVSTNLLEQRTVVQLLVTALSRQRRAETGAERPSDGRVVPRAPPGHAPGAR